MTSRSGALEGKVVVVTGAARGIGALLAQRLAHRGAKVALLGLEGGELARITGGCGPAAACWEVDVTDPTALQAVAAAVLEHFGRVDVVVANAGIAAGGPLLLADPTSYERVLEVNLLGSIRTARAFLPALVDSRGYLLQVASLAAMVPAPLMSAYCASKAGVEAFAHGVGVEVAHRGVRVGVAYLSWTNTDMVRGADAQPGLGELRASLPSVFGRTYPLEPAVDRLVDGIARRAPHVYAPGWVRAVALTRGVLPSVVARLVSRRSATAETVLREAGPTATRAVGAGGHADDTARAVPRRMR